MNVKSLVYCLLVKTEGRLVLVDTGFGTQDYRHPTRKMRFFQRWMGVPCTREETALSQVKQLGYRPDEVTDIICTHLHIDHTGGISDFPDAAGHVFHPELQFALQPRGWSGFALEPAHWAHQPHWNIHNHTGETWFGLDGIRILTSLETDFWLLPMPGHTPGHCGVALGKPGHWLLHCGDAASPYHPHTDLHNRGRSAYRLAFFPSSVTKRLSGAYTEKLRTLLKEHPEEIRAISSHDIFSFREFRSAR